MSIATEYTRLKNAKENIKASITGKGVTVPDGTKLDGMSVLIDEISASLVPYNPSYFVDETIDTIQKVRNAMKESSNSMLGRGCILSSP